MVLVALAVNEIFDGLDRLPLFVTLIVLTPADAGVYVNVAEGVPVLRLTVDGVKVPPPPPLLGVIVVLEAVPPEGVSVTVKLLDAALTTPELGPVMEYPVATAAFTVSVTALDVALPLLSVTVTRYWSALFALPLLTVVAAVV